MRWIVAFDIDIPVAERLVLLQEELDDAVHQLGGDVSWRPAEELRLPLIVVPDPDPAVLPAFRAAVDEVAASTDGPIVFGLRGTALHPSPQCPRNVLVGIADAYEQIHEMHRRLGEARDRFVSSRDVVRFEPLVRVGRIKSPRRPLDLRGLVRRFASTDYGRTKARDLVVLLSELHGTTVRQRVIHRARLSGAEDLDTEDATERASER